MLSKVDSFQRHIIRTFALNVRWPTIVKNEKNYAKMKLERWSTKKALKMAWKNSPNGYIYSSSLCFTLCFKRIQMTQRKTTDDMVIHNKTTIKKRTHHEQE